jgi:DNA adenine methylase
MNKKNVFINPNLKTPITYYGGKQQLLKVILPLIPEHNVYSEAFLGGGAVFWAKKPSRVEFLNDHNGEVINFYRVLKHNYPALKHEIDATLHSEFQQKEAKAIYKNPAGHSDVKRAWALWVLSHQSFYAILDGTWKCSRERSFGDQLHGRTLAFAEEYAKRLEHASIFCRDALSVIQRSDTEHTFHYVDPPYYQADMGHYAGYTKEDFVALLEVLSTLKGKFMLSSYPSDVLSEYATRNNWNLREYIMPRSAGGGKKTEVITMNYTVEQQPIIELKQEKKHGQAFSANEYEEYAMAA